MSQLGRISGPLLKANLLRDGVDLAFETDLLYLDVINGRIGINTTAPTHDLQVVGTTRTTNLEVTTQADIATFTVSGDTISSTSGTINLEPSGVNPVVYQAKLTLNSNLQLSTNTIETTVLDSDLNINTLGTGKVNINANVLIDGDLHGTGNITADGDITIGDGPTDVIVFNSEIASDIIPNDTDTYNLGSDPTAGGKAWSTAYIYDLIATNISANTVDIGGIDLALPQGNIRYVSVNGSDLNAGVHENNPYGTLKYALNQAVSGDTIYVYPGVYSEIFPLTIPTGVTVKGAGIRSVTIQPTVATKDQNAFLMNGETTVEDLTIANFLHNSINDTGHAFTFAPNFKVIKRSPYIRNISVITRGTPTELSVAALVTENNASIAHIKSIIDDIVVNNITATSLGNAEIQVTDLANPSDAATGLALQGLFDDVLYVINNGAAIASLPAITPNGALTTDVVKLNAAALITANITFLKQEMYGYLLETVPGFWSTWSEVKAKRDLGIILDAVIYDITHGGNEKSIEAGIGFWQHPTSDPLGFDQQDAGRGAFADGALADPTSNEAAMLFHSVTFITPWGSALKATSGVRIEWLNSFTYFADKGLYAYSSPVGFAGGGLTRLRIDSQTGTWAVGNTLSYYDTDGTTLLASGTIASIDGDYVNLTGRQLGFETITDRLGKTVYPQGDAKLSTAQAKFGPSSLALDGTGDYVTVATSPDFNFGTGDFTIETWLYRNNVTGNQYVFDLRTSTNPALPLLYFAATSLVYYANGANRIIGTVSTTLTWLHIALVRNGSDNMLFVNGTQLGSTWVDATDMPQGAITIGASYVATSSFNGYIDDFRVSKGIARYTTNFTAPTLAFVGDLNTVLLLHFNGNNNSTTLLDDGITFQDLRTSAGGTASLINFADYSDFGAEIRAIGSANIYGNYGAYGDGVGVIAYLISQNFAYIGSGKLSNNDPNDRIAANEVVELNGAQIHYTSVDNEGNFSVGDSFYVNQKTGEVLFSNQNLTITSATGVIFTDGTNTTTITSTDITTGNIQISGNTIESLTGDVNITAASGSINLQNNTYISGTLDVTGNTTFNGDVIIGNASTDTINFVGSINSDIIPSPTATYNLGSDLLRWDTAYLSRVEVDGVVIDNNTISTTLDNDDLTLIANGTGRVYIPNSDVQIDQNLTVTTDLTVTTGTTYLKSVDITGNVTQDGDINQTGNFTTSGTADITGNITGTGYLQLPQIRVENNVISTTTTDTNLELQANGTGNVVIEGIQVSDNNIQSTATNSDITLVPQGTGNVVINSNQSLQIPVGTTAERPDPASNGMIRFNTDLQKYEGYNNGLWLVLSGVQDADGNTRIIAEATPGANDNIIYFYVDNALMATLDSTKLFVERLQTANLDITGNSINAIAPNTDIIFTTAGTGGVRLGNVRIRNNTITNIVSNAVTEFAQAGEGYIRIAGTNGVVIPSGNTLTDRPITPELGMIRFNVDGQLVEVYNGVNWSGVAGESGGVTAVEATEIGITSALIFG